MTSADADSRSTRTGLPGRHAAPQTHPLKSRRKGRLGDWALGARQGAVSALALQDGAPSGGNTPKRRWVRRRRRLAARRRSGRRCRGGWLACSPAPSEPHPLRLERKGRGVHPRWSWATARGAGQGLTGQRGAGHPRVLSVAAVVLSPGALGALLHRQLVARAAHLVQQHRAGARPEVGLRPGSGHAAGRARREFWVRRRGRLPDFPRSRQAPEDNDPRCPGPAHPAGHVGPAAPYVSVALTSLAVTRAS